MLGNVLFPSTYVHSHLFNWLSFYVLRNKHAYFYPLSQLFSSYSLWILTKRIISLHFFIVVAKVTWRKKLTTLIPFAWINLQYVHSHYIFCHNFSLVLSGMFDLLKYGFCSHKPWINNNVYLTYELILWLQHCCGNVWHSLLANTEVFTLGVASDFSSSTNISAVFLEACKIWTVDSCAVEMIYHGWDNGYRRPMYRKR